MEKAEILTKFEEIIASHGYLLIDTVFRGDNHLRIIEVYIDNDKGITADDCTVVSRALNELIESQDLIGTSYRLDVSSPGIERPLKYLVQYGKHVNRKFEVSYNSDGVEKKLTAKLIRIVSDDLFFADKEIEIKINYKDIIKAKVLISF